MFFILVLILVQRVGFPAIASYNGQDASASRQLTPDSLRVTIDTGEFHWQRLRYEAELRVSAFYPLASAADRPDSLTMFVDVATPGAIFWVESGDEKYQRSDFLILRKDKIQAKGKISWRRK